MWFHIIKFFFKIGYKLRPTSKHHQSATKRLSSDVKAARNLKIIMSVLYLFPCTKNS